MPVCSGEYYGVTRMAAQTQNAPTILRRKQVEARTGLSRSTLYSMTQRGQFPRPIPLSVRTVGWLESEIEQWIAGRAAERVKD
jgi:prophage regulatory protein